MRMPDAEEIDEPEKSGSYAERREDADARFAQGLGSRERACLVSRQAPQPHRERHPRERGSKGTTFRRP